MNDNRHLPLFAEMTADAPAGGGGGGGHAAAAGSPPPPGAADGDSGAGGFLHGADTATAAAAAAEGKTAAFFGGHVQKDGVFQEGWSEGLQRAGYGRLANKAALAKDETTFFKSLDDALGLIGKKSAGARYPKEGFTEREIAEYRKEAGVPETWDGYELKPAKLPDGVEWNDSEMQGYAEIFHKHHVPRAAAAELVERHLAQVAGQTGAIGKHFQEKIAGLAATSEATFQKEWGQGYDARLEANRAFVASRFDAGELADPALQAALSHPKVVRVIDEARRALREAPLPGVGAEAAGGSMSPRQQAYEIMKANPGWRKDAETAKRVNDLYALDAAQGRRR